MTSSRRANTLPKGVPPPRQAASGRWSSWCARGQQPAARPLTSRCSSASTRRCARRGAHGACCASTSAFALPCAHCGRRAKACAGGAAGTEQLIAVLESTRAGCSSSTASLVRARPPRGAAARLPTRAHFFNFSNNPADSTPICDALSFRNLNSSSPAAVGNDLRRPLVLVANAGAAGAAGGACDDIAWARAAGEG